MSTTTGTEIFNLNLNDIIEEAFERAGSEVRSGYNVRTARRSLNLLTIEWANRGVNLWTIEEGQIPLVQGQVTYPLPVDTIDLIEHVVRTSNGIQSTQTDINITRISVSTYATIPNKITQGRPIQVWVDRQSGVTGKTGLTLASNIGPNETTIPLSSTVGLPATGYVTIDNETINYTNTTGTDLLNCIRGQNGTNASSHLANAVVTAPELPNINVWPAPDQGTAASPVYTFVYWRLRRIQDAGNGVNIQDIPFRLLPCLTAGLAYYIAMKIPEGADRLAMLKAAYEEQWLLASGEDREKASVRFVPRNMFVTGGGY
jgi:hypothetical protein